jgi:hypothetical protein
MNRNWILVNFGSEPTDRKYLNKRIEMWGTMKDWLIGGGSIPNESDLCADLIAPEVFEIQTGKNAGRLQMESKEDMRDRGLPSPDDADALALTFAYPVQNKSQKQFERLMPQTQEYDPFGSNVAQPVEQYSPLSPVAEVPEISRPWRMPGLQLV